MTTYRLDELAKLASEQGLEWPWHSHGVVQFMTGASTYIECDELDILVGLGCGDLVMVSQYLRGELKDRWLAHKEEPLDLQYIQADEELRAFRLGGVDAAQGSSRKLSMIDLDAEFERACSKPHEGAAFDALSLRDKILISIWGLEADVNNGGFDQYYFNGSGDQALFVVDALEEIGAQNMAAIVREANEKFGANGPARDRTKRQEQLEQLTASEEDLFDPLDRRFYDYPDDIAALLMVFLVAVGSDDCREST